MKKLNLLIFTVLCTVGLTSSSFAQEYLEMIDAGTFTVAEIQESAKAHFEINGTDRGSGYKQFKRWEYNALRMQDDDGRLRPQSFYIEELERFDAYLNESTEARATGGGTGNWEEMGPTTWNDYQGWNPGIGRVTGFAVDPADMDYIVIGAQTGGVWRTTDGGANWSPLTDYFVNMTVYSIAMDPQDTSVLWFGSSNGVIYKSTDSGDTWTQMGTAGFSLINKILIHPTDSDIMFASGQNAGIYKSTDGGATWSDVIASATRGYDVEFKPGDPSTVYASGNRFYRSTDGGDTFATISGFATAPKMIGVSPDDADRVYVVEASGSAFGGFYSSGNSGASFTELNHAGNNYFGYSTSASDGSGQAPRDMDIIVNPTDADEVYIAGILAWRSFNAGVSFECTSGWALFESSSFNVGYCHADIDIMEYVNDKVFVGSDGGLFVANDPQATMSTTFYEDLSFGLGIRQFYKIGISQSDPVIISGGAQDNGTSVLTTGGEWRDWLGADGMETFVDYNNNNFLFGTTQGGQLYRSVNGGVTYSNMNEPSPGGGNWVSPFEQDPATPTTLYVGYNRVNRSTNSGGSWTAISQTFPTNLDVVKISPSNSNIIWASWDAALYKTTDGGATTTWPSVSGTAGNINDIAIHPNDPNKVAIATSFNGAKVYVTLDGGATWINYKKNLPDFTALSVVWDDTSVNGLYVGMNYGLFYIDDTVTDWQVFNTNLPNVIINELEINNVNDRIYAATYGRGVWSSPVYDNPLSVADNTFNDLVRLYPNPAANQVTIAWPTTGEVDIQVFDLNGRLLINKKDEQVVGSYTLDIAKLSAGVHFVRLSSEGSTIVKKLIVQ